MAVVLRPCLRPGVRGTRLAIEGATVACDSASCTDMIGAISSWLGLGKPDPVWVRNADARILSVI